MMAGAERERAVAATSRDLDLDYLISSTDTEYKSIRILLFLHDTGDLIHFKYRVWL